MSMKKKMLLAASGSGGGSEYWMYSTESNAQQLYIPARSSSTSGIIIVEAPTSGYTDWLFYSVDHDTGNINDSKLIVYPNTYQPVGYGTYEVMTLDGDDVLHHMDNFSQFHSIDVSNGFSISESKTAQNNGTYYPDIRGGVTRYDSDNDVFWTCGNLEDVRNANYSYTYGDWTWVLNASNLTDYQSSIDMRGDISYSVFSQVFASDLIRGVGSGATSSQDDWYKLSKGVGSWHNNGSLKISKYNYNGSYVGGFHLKYNNSSVYRRPYDGFFFKDGSTSYLVTVGNAYHDNGAKTKGNISIFDVTSFGGGTSLTDQYYPGAAELDGYGNIFACDYDRTNEKAYFGGYFGNTGEAIAWIAKTSKRANIQDYWVTITPTNLTDGYIYLYNMYLDDNGTNPALLVHARYKESSSDVWTNCILRLPEDLDNYIGTTLGPFTIADASSSYSWQSTPGFTWETSTANNTLYGTDISWTTDPADPTVTPQTPTATKDNLD